MKVFCFLLGTLLLLTACAAPAVSARPTLAILTLQHSLAARGWAEQAGRCAAAQPDLRVVIREVPAPALDPAQADLTIRFGSPEGFAGFAAVLGQDSLAVILNPQNPLTSLAVEQLSAIYTGQVKSWSELTNGTGAFKEPIQAWAYPAGDDLQGIFNREILQDNAPTRPYLAPDPQAMLAAVQTNRGAVGFLPKGMLPQGVQAPGLIGLPDDSAQFPVLSLSTAEPQGAARQIVVCLQGKG